METVILNGLYFLVEFTKVYILVRFYLKKSIHKRMKVLFPASMAGVMIGSYWYSMVNQSIIFLCIILLLFLLTLSEARSILFVILSYVGVSLIDMMNGIILSYLVHYLGFSFDFSGEWDLLINLVSLIILWGGLFYIRMKGNYTFDNNGYYTGFLFLLGGFMISVYLSYVMLNSEDGNYNRVMFLSSLFIFFVFGALIIISIKTQSEKMLLEIENENNKTQLELQNNYYTDLLKIDTETRMFRHDVKEHILCLTVLAKEKNYDELIAYLNQMNEGIRNIAPKFKTGNQYIDVIIFDLMEKYPKVKLEWTGYLPILKLDSMDICILFSNLLKNAFESATDIDDMVSVEIKIQKNSVYIYICNRYFKIVKLQDGEFKTTKNGKQRGYGMKNVQSIVDKYKGVMDIETVDFQFQVKIVLPEVVE